MPMEKYGTIICLVPRISLHIVMMKSKEGESLVSFTCDAAAHRHHGYNEPVTSQLERADLCGSDRSIERLYTVKKVHILWPAV